MKKWLAIGILIFLAVIISIVFLRGSEDSWIKDKNGIYVKHGVPSETPTEVYEQQQAIECARGLYAQAKNSGMQFSSQCLGTCKNYAVDIVHAPRTAEDNLIENQCEDYREGKVVHFIELDKDGEVVKIV